MSIGPQHNGGILGATNNPTSTSAGGIWTPVQHYQAQRDGLWPVATAPLPDYTISRSLRFNKTDSAALNYTPAIAGNRKTWILSTWVKSPGTFMTNDNPIFAVRPGATPYTLVTLRASNAGTAPSTLLIEDNASGMVLSTAMVFRDYSAWYHIVVAIDTTQSVNTNRVKMFVNGVQVTTFAGYTTYPNQNIDTQINSTNTHYIGRDPYDTNNWYSGYLADFRFIDGYPSGIDGTSWNNAGSIINLFGETDLTTGVWRPKAYSGSYGTNGFYLPFTDNSTQNNLGVNTAQVGDELRNYTVLHLSGNPANTSGYNCFSDRSSNNHLLTASGDIPTSARSPFTDTASGSAYFNGSSYLTIPHNSILNFDTGTFTVEAWVYPTVGNTYHTITGKWANLNQDNWLVTINNNALLFFYNGGSLSGGTVSTNVWTHVAVSRNSSNLITLYVNGIAVATTTNAFNSGYTYQLEIGSYAGGSNKFNGYISNLRIIKGQALFTGNFTPSSSPLTSTAVGHTGTGAASSITGTVSLLTLVDKVGANNSGFIDESTNNAVITRSGNVTQGSFSPFGTSGWAMYQSDISGNYPSFTTSAGTAFQFTGNFTIEGWVYPIIYSGTGDTSLWVTFDGSTYLALNYDGSGNYNIYLNSGAVTSTFSSGIVANTWNHVAMVRSGSTITLYTNGVSRGTIQNSATLGHANPSLARIGGGVASCSRYVSNLRIIKGTALYTSNFIPSTTPLTATTGTVLLTCQDNRFVDNSANNFTVTFTGTPQVQPLSPFQPHTSVTNTYSNFFDGTNDYIQSTLPSTITGTFTIDFWWYRPASGVATIFNIGDSMSADSAEVYIGTNGTILKYYNNNNERITTSTLPTLSAWNYLAVTRDSSNVVRLYLNGTQVGGTYVQTGNLSTQLRIGCEYYNGAPAFAVGGYISNFRVSNIVRDVSSLPSAPFVSDANTLALTCQDSTFKDNSSYGSTVTVYDAPRISEFNPLGRTFTTGVNYSATTHGSSAYFDGSTDYLTVPSSSNFNFGTNDFTIECWVYQLSRGTDSFEAVWTLNGPGVTGGTTPFNSGMYLTFGSYFNQGTLLVSNSSENGWALQILNISLPRLFTWEHYAVTRVGSNWTVYKNGAVAGTGTYSGAVNASRAPFAIGTQTSGGVYWPGYIANFRVINGTALYKSNFVPQLQPPQAVANTQLLLNFNNAGVVDYSGKGVLETVGDSRSVTSTKKSLLDATGSVYFDGTNDYLRSSLPASYWNLSGDFTVEFWINPIGNSQSGSVYYDIIGTSNNQSYIGSGQTGWIIAWSAQYGLRFGWQNSNTWSIDQSLHSTTPTLNTWAHIAVVRRGSTITGYINGIAGSTPITSSTNLTSSLYSLHIGSGAGNQNFTLNGYLQDVRITTIARYTGTFTPPVRTFSATVRDIGHKQWVVNNLSVASGAGNDSLVDSPTPYGVDTGLGGEVRGNYCTMNPINKVYSSDSFANGNLECIGGFAYPNYYGTMSVSSGKWYYEVVVTQLGSTVAWVGFSEINRTKSIGVGVGSAVQYIKDGTQINYGTARAVGDIIGIAANLDNNEITFFKNGVSQGAVSNTFSGYTWTPWGTGGGGYTSGDKATVNFGQRPFAYTAPSGYKALCTQNLPAPSIVKPNTAFDTALYTGNGTSITVSGLNFSPDLVWMKARSGAFQHGLFDRVRGNGLGLVSNSTAVETSYAAGTFTNDGFTNSTDYNGSGVTYAAWSWDENPAAGVDIALATANASAVVTYNHSLGVSPAFVISKSRSAAVPWLVYHKSLGANQYLLLNTTDAATTLNGVYTASSSQFAIASQTANATYVSYLFAEMPGFSAFGSYTGNGSTDGPFVYTGFRPAWIMIKRSDSVENWNLYDNKRNRYNIADLELYPNLTNSEGTTADRDFLSNGFKIRSNNIGRNASGGTYIYAAFAENPFKYSLAR